jgi:hypothetical protein
MMPPISLGSESPHRVGADVTEGPYPQQGCRRGLVVGELGNDDDVVLADRIERFTYPAALALGELGEILQALLSGGLAAVSGALAASRGQLAPCANASADPAINWTAIAETSSPDTRVSNSTPLGRRTRTTTSQYRRKSRSTTLTAISAAERRSRPPRR